MMIIICGILISQNIVFAESEIFVGDINKSSVIDDEDIEIMQEYLIKTKDVISLEQADMNNDSKLSLIDLSLLIKQQKECPYDKYNVTGISAWTSIPMVSDSLLQKEGVTTGGEGCQWPIGMAISKDGKLWNRCRRSIPLRRWWSKLGTIKCRTTIKRSRSICHRP